MLDFTNKLCLSAFLLLFSAPAAWFTQGQQAPDLSGKNIVFVIGEREYKTNESLPAFADRFLVPAGARCTFVLADPEDPYDFPGIENLRDADLMVLSVRRRLLEEEAFAHVKTHLDSGKPLVALRTASHAFHDRTDPPPAGHVEWRTFDVDVLGARYDGHYDNDLLPEISPAPGAEDHPILEGVEDLPFVSGGSLYQSRALAPTTRVLLNGKIVEKGKERIEPVAWTNVSGPRRVFYSSLGHPADFEQPAFQKLLFNAIQWAVED